MEIVKGDDVISGKSTVALASGLIVVATILSLSFGVFRPSSNGGTPQRPVAEPAAAAPGSTAETGASPAPPSASVASEVLTTVTGALATATKNVSAPVGPGGPQVGVRVHGDWTIEIRQPDGTLVSRREFQNALIQGGPEVLASYLSRRWVQGLWYVWVGETASTGPCLDSGTPTNCTLAEPASTVTAGNVFKNLTVTYQGAYLENLVLAGTATAQRDGSVGRVSTNVLTCPSSTLPANCLDSNGNLMYFTSTTLSTPVAVLSGQLIQVSVTISFS